MILLEPGPPSVARIWLDSRTLAHAVLPETTPVLVACCDDSERAVTLARSTRVELDDLPSEVRGEYSRVLGVRYHTLGAYLRGTNRGGRPPTPS